MLFDELISHPAKWMIHSRDAHDIVLTSRIRLARNLSHTPFPGWATRRQLKDILATVSEKLLAHPVAKDGFYTELSELNQQQKQLLVERHLISRELAARAEGCGVLIAKSQQFGVLINEEDHMRLQYILPGNQLTKAWLTLSDIDTALEEQLPYAYNAKFGYLTSCPSNLGTGLRASVMMHLPGLVIAEQMPRVIKAAEQLNITIRGLYGEGTEASGNIFQISNQSTLGDSEEQIIDRITRFTTALAKREWDMRRNLFQASPRQIKDRVARAYGILQQAELLTTQEALGLLSYIRMGASLDIFKHCSLDQINRYTLRIQPAHISTTLPEDTKADSEMRDAARAELLRSTFNATAE